MDFFVSVPDGGCLPPVPDTYVKDLSPEFLPTTQENLQYVERTTHI